jgi:hypothetical protein
MSGQMHITTTHAIDMPRTYAPRYDPYGPTGLYPGDPFLDARAHANRPYVPLAPHRKILILEYGPTGKRVKVAVLNNEVRLRSSLF